MKPALTWIRRLWIPVFLIACTWFLVRHADGLLQGEALAPPRHPVWLVVALGVQAGVWFMLVTGWRRVVRARLGLHTPLVAAFVQFALFSFGKYLPGKVWGIAARAVEMKGRGVEVGDNVDVTVFEQYLVLHSAAVLAALLAPLVMPGWLPWGLAVLALASAPFAAPLFDRGIGLVTGRFSSSASRGMGTRMSPGFALSLVGHYGVAWALHGAVLALLHASLSGGAAILDPQVLGLFLLANTIGMVAGFAAVFAPAGLGIREAAMAAILATGMPLQDAIALSVAMRLWTVGTDIGFGGLALLSRAWR